MTSLEKEADDLKQVGRHLKSFPGAIAGIVALVPLGGTVFESILPPWEPIIALTLVANIAALCFVFIFLRELTPLTLWRLSIGLIILGTLAFGAYVVLSQLFILEHKGSRVVTGITLSPEASALVEQKKVPSAHPRDLLTHYGFQSASLAWSDQPHVSLAITLSFLVTCVCLSAGFFAMVVRNLAKDRAPRTP